jgi:hypothetical protein
MGKARCWKHSMMAVVVVCEWVVVVAGKKRVMMRVA